MSRSCEMFLSPTMIKFDAPIKSFDAALPSILTGWQTLPDEGSSWTELPELMVVNNGVIVGGHVSLPSLWLPGTACDIIGTSGTYLLRA